MRWHSGPVSSKLSTPRTVILSSYFKANKILSDAEVAKNVAKLVECEKASIPQNTVTPGLYAELQKLGVPTTAMFSLDTDAMRSGIREAFTQINGDNLHEAIDLMDSVQSVRAWAFKDVSRMMDALAGKNKDLRNTLHTLFEEPHSRATGNYANGIANLNRQLLDIGKRAGVFDEKGKSFDKKESAFIEKRNTKSEPAARRQRV